MNVYPAWIGTTEMIVIFLVVLLLFGAKRLPEIARSLGKASNEFKKARREFSDVANELTSEPPPAPAKPAPLPKAEEAADDNKKSDV